MSNYENILYSKGYVFANKECKVPEHFSCLRVSSYNFYYDKNLETFYIEDKANNDWILVCGILLDAVEGIGCLEAISNRLFSKRKKSKSQYLDYLDSLGGRYIIVIKYQDEVEVYNDACGNKIVNYFFSNSQVCLSSHLGLIKDNFNLIPSGVEKERTILKKNFRYGYPGMSTPLRDVKKLIPNTSLNILTKATTRYFPREDLKKISLEEAYSDIKVLFNNQFKSLLKLGLNPLISLTAGWDSRFTISILDSLTEASYFTYRSFEAHNTDVSIAKIISQKLNLKYSILYNKDYSFGNDYLKYNSIINKNTYLKHGRQISYMYFNSFKDGNYVHIRSNLSEIGRFFYGKCKDFQLNELSLLFLWGSINKEYVSSQIIRNAFREFFVKNRYDNIYNYNAFDLFYWEHRMGQWNSEVLIEGDPAFNTIQLFNCRKVLKSLLALTESDRKNDSIYKYAIFEKGRSELFNIPLNPDQEQLAEFLAL